MISSSQTRSVPLASPKQTLLKPCNAHVLWRKHSKPIRSATAAVAGSVPNAVAAPQDAWEQFADNVSGEWEGVTASFSPEGRPLPLPEHYVPEAFREWGVELWDWQSQSSTLATPASAPAGSNEPTAGQLRSVVRRLMPTVGCEADAIAYTEEDACISSSSSSSDSGGSSDGSASSSSQVLVFTHDGSYSSGPGVLPPISKDSGPGKLQIEHCFALPHDPASSSTSSSSSSSTSGRYRLKVVQQFRRNWASGAWVLDSVDLHKERFDGPYTGKRELAGCGGGQPGIAQLPALQANQLAGNWVCSSAVSTAVGASDSSEHSGRLSCLDLTGAAPEGTQITLLPLGAWSSVKLSAAGQLQRAEAGVLLGQQQQNAADAAAQRNVPSDSSGSACSRVVCSWAFDDSTGQLQQAHLGVESCA